MGSLGFHCHDLAHLETIIVSNGLHWGEFYNFTLADLPGLMKEIEQHGLAASVHAPLIKTLWYPTPPTISFLCDLDKEKRQLSLAMVEDTMKVACPFGAEYVLVHFPVPSTTSINGLGYTQLKVIAWDGACRLAEFADKYQIPIHMEGFGPSPFLTADFLNEYEFAHQLSPNIGSVHLWNNRGIQDYFSFAHIPCILFRNHKMVGWMWTVFYVS